MNKTQRDYALSKARRTLKALLIGYKKVPSIKEWLTNNPEWAKLKPKDEIGNIAGKQGHYNCYVENFLVKPKQIVALEQENETIRLKNEKIQKQIEIKLEEIEDFLYLGSEDEVMEMLKDLKNFKVEV